MWPSIWKLQTCALILTKFSKGKAIRLLLMHPQNLKDNRKQSHYYTAHLDLPTFEFSLGICEAQVHNITTHRLGFVNTRYCCFAHMAKQNYSLRLNCNWRNIVGKNKEHILSQKLLTMRWKLKRFFLKERKFHSMIKRRGVKCRSPISLSYIEFLFYLWGELHPII